MRPDIEETAATRGSAHRRHVRFFVALHLGAVGAIYAVAVIMGGGVSGPPMPPLTVAMAQPPVAPATQAPHVAMPMALPVTPSPAPEWARRTEIAAPWEAR